MSYDLDELERLEKAATPGPWGPNPRSELCVVGSSGRTVAAVGQYSSNVDAEAVYAENLANGGLIVAARNALPAMIRDLREAEEIMREVEWSAEIPYENTLCSWCLRPRPEGHAPDCRLKAWLERRG